MTIDGRIWQVYQIVQPSNKEIIKLYENISNTYFSYMRIFKRTTVHSMRVLVRLTFLPMIILL